VRPFITTWSTPVGTTITIPTNGAGYDFEVNWNYADDPENFTGHYYGNATYIYTAADTVSGDAVESHQIAIRGLFPRMYLYNN
jgi:hypothetical protein